MALFKGGALRLFQTFLYAILFCCAAIILGIFSYFLAVLADRNDGIATQWKAVEGLSGAATLYLIFAVLLTCCLGGITFLAFLAIVLDICFCGAMVAIAILTRHGDSSCSGNVNTPLGSGPAASGYGFGDDGSGGFSSTGANNNVTYKVRNGTACKMTTACFAVSIVGALLFLVTAALQLLLVRHHQKEKRFGPSPSNNYTSGSGKKGGLFSRNKKNKNFEKDSELGATGTAVGAGGLAAGHHDTRPSHETGYTGSTVAGTSAYDKVNEPAVPNTHSTHGGYYTQPQGTGVNPYGYDTNTTTHTTTTGPHYTTGTATNY